MVTVMIPFSGYVSETYSQEIAKAVGVMKSSDFIPCINKCGLYLHKLREELVSQKKSADYLKQVFINKLNDHYERNKQSIRLWKTDIFFTDWELEGNQDSGDFGRVGVKEIKGIMTDYLVDYGIYKSNETDELEKYVSFLYKARL